MASGSDLKDMLGLDQSQAINSGGGGGLSHIESILNIENKKKPKKIKKLPPPVQVKKPDGMARELFNLLRDGSGNSGSAGLPVDKTPLIQTDSKAGYKALKVKMSKLQPRAWKLTPFTNPTRDDGMIFFHWRREADPATEYPFARFNKKVSVPVYTTSEYNQHLLDSDWSREETDHLMSLCRSFDLRFVVIHDRYDTQSFKQRSIEDIKERYYWVSSKLQHVRAGNAAGEPPRVYDADHERKRKLQLEKLWNRTPAEVREEERLIEELKRIETRKRERERKAQDLQKLISAVDSRTGSTSSSSAAPPAGKAHNKAASAAAVTPGSAVKRSAPSAAAAASSLSTAKSAAELSVGIKWPVDTKPQGACLRSHRMKMPMIGQKKMKAIDEMLVEHGLELWPRIATEEIVEEFNELRSDLAILYELRQATEAIDFDLKSTTHTYNTLRARGLSPKRRKIGGIFEALKKNPDTSSSNRR